MTIKNFYFASISLLILLFPTKVLPQGMYFPNGISAQALTIGCGANKESSITGGSVSYSINSILDIGFSITEASYRYTNDNEMTFISPFIQIQALKHNYTIPLSISFFYEYSSTIEVKNGNPKPTSHSFGLSLYRNIKIVDNLMLIP